MPDHLLRYRYWYFDLHGNPSTHCSLPLWVAVIDWIGQHTHPHWDWWQAAWMKVTPYYGDPVCYWYCAHLSPWVHRFETCP